MTSKEEPEIDHGLVEFFWDEKRGLHPLHLSDLGYKGHYNHGKRIGLWKWRYGEEEYNIS